MKLKPGFYQNQQVHKLGSMDYFSWTKCSAILDSPRAFFERYKGMQVWEPTKQMQFGQLVHMALLEPKKFREKFVVQPEFTGFTKDGKPSTRSADALEKKAEWTEKMTKAEKVIVEQDDMDRLIAIVDRVMEHDKARELLTGAHSEGWAYAWDEEFGRYILSRADSLTENSVVIEIKTTTKRIDRKSFAKLVFWEGYHGQVALNCRAVGILKGIDGPHRRAIFIAIHVGKVIDVAVYTASENIMIAGELLAKSAMGKINKLLEIDPNMNDKKLWCGVQNNIVEEIDFEPWMTRDEEMYDELSNELQP